MLLKSDVIIALITWSVVVDPRNVVHALSMLIGDGSFRITLKSTTLLFMRMITVMIVNHEIRDNGASDLWTLHSVCAHREP